MTQMQNVSSSLIAGSSPLIDLELSIISTGYTVRSEGWDKAGTSVTMVKSTYDLSDLQNQGQNQGPPIKGRCRLLGASIPLKSINQEDNDMERSWDYEAQQTTNAKSAFTIQFKLEPGGNKLRSVQTNYARSSNTGQNASKKTVLRRKVTKSPPRRKMSFSDLFFGQFGVTVDPSGAGGGTKSLQPEKTVTVAIQDFPCARNKSDDPSSL